ncbi:laminin subunit alpha-2-like [Colias croceus]|uniref:laminin subunit alpha-2-like n=1 Tax=Colias crocea TaxID=72248 RepID=UPI001E27AC38|nr:laminin subunit alpha-2-like [Colias croceus]
MRRALLDRLSSTTLSETAVASEGLLPAPVDVAPYCSVVANGTCGERGEEEFCRETPGKRGIACDVCEGPEGSASRQHPASLAIDGDPATWWQTPTLAAGEEYRHVEFVATLPDKMELLHVIIKSGPSPRPLAWSLEVSPTEAADDWRLLRAFGDRDHCKKLWDLRPERKRRKVRAQKGKEKVSCSTQFANPKPVENGEMHVAIGEGVTVRRVRISFRATHALPHNYYTVRELTLAARCLCHGHASHCNVNDKGAKCDCLHGTCGGHCQRCCSGSKWQPHRPCAPSGDCSCGERGECAFDDTGDVLCVNCTDNRAGPLCDRCLVGFYNALPDGPCVPCDCDPEGSDGSCNWDKQQQRVLCTCHAGFSGPKCESCEDINAVFPNCVVDDTTPSCKCDPRGIVDPSRVCEDVCECKANVIGERCDECASGYFGLSADLADGCLPCYCSHLAETCRVNHRAHMHPDVVLPMGEAWLISDAALNETLEPSVDEQGKPYLITYEVEGWESFYWLTNSFSGEQLEAYGSEVKTSMYWSVARGDTGGSPTVGPDVILVANDGRKLTYINSSHEFPGQLELSVVLVEGNWYLENELATRTQLLDVLSDLRAIMIRAHYHNDQDEVRLEGVEILSGHTATEICACPNGYEGSQCAQCAWTHVRIRRAPTALPAFECVPCACNMHAGCASVDGPCGECQHNTTGPHCERCLPGHYGNPVTGGCKPCACPLYEASNNFSPNCALAGAEGDDFVCTQCPDGYTGDHCETCDSGYWGSPTTPGGSCVPCACGGGPCNVETGACLVCPPHTEGETCDQCQEGYYSLIEGGACLPCECGRGALSSACDVRTGACACAPNWTGRACDSCSSGYGDVEAGCPACRCGVAALSGACDPASGRCACSAGAEPPRCDTCRLEYWDLSADGCRGAINIIKSAIECYDKADKL